MDSGDAQVDVFWSFAVGANLACMAAHELARGDGGRGALINRYFVYTLLFLGVIFNPAGAYLLHAFPYWESMFVFSTTAEMHPILPTVFSSTNVLLGALGFVAARNYIVTYGPTKANFLWVYSYGIMFAILGIGYQRFTYAGDANDWAEGREFTLLEFFSSPVFLALAVMSAFVVPALLLPAYTWPRATGMLPGDKQEHLDNIRRDIVVAVVAVTAAFTAWHLAATDAQLAQVADGPLGSWAPLAGFYAACAAFYPLTLAAFVLAPTA